MAGVTSRQQLSSSSGMREAAVEGKCGHLSGCWKAWCPLMGCVVTVPGKGFDRRCAGQHWNITLQEGFSVTSAVMCIVLKVMYSSPGVADQDQLGKPG